MTWTKDASQSIKQSWVKWDHLEHMQINTERPKEEHSGESFILVNLKDWMHIWSTCALMHAAWRTNRKKQSPVCSYKVTDTLGSWSCGRRLTYQGCCHEHIHALWEEQAERAVTGRRPSCDRVVGMLMSSVLGWIWASWEITGRDD